MDLLTFLKANPVVELPKYYLTCQRLRDEHAFDLLVSLTGVDWGTSLEVVVHLARSSDLLRVVVKTLVEEDQLVPSLTPLWPGANWHERECFDLLGLKFQGHPDLRRIFLPENYSGHPLRKAGSSQS